MCVQSVNCIFTGSKGERAGYIRGANLGSNGVRAGSRGCIFKE